MIYFEKNVLCVYCFHVVDKYIIYMYNNYYNINIDKLKCNEQICIKKKKNI